MMGCIAGKNEGNRVAHNLYLNNIEIRVNSSTKHPNSFLSPIKMAHNLYLNRLRYKQNFLFFFFFI